MTLALVGFLVAHGLLHLAIWMPHPVGDAATPPPFHPDHSPVLTAAHVRGATTHRLSVVLAVSSTVAYLSAAAGLVAGAAWVPLVAVGAGTLGLLLKGLFFHPWLLVGIALDALVLLAASTGWPVSLS